MEMPAVSVIIPLFNAEKFIGECLDSVLNQTFKNFEVIVVDDCSTDSSVDIVNSYAPKFAGRLQLSSTKKNSGSPVVPRNRGIELSRGKYLFFLDSDDVISPTALEELYPVAEDFAADVVHCESFFRTDEEQWNYDKVMRLFEDYRHQSDKAAPHLLSDDIAERLEQFKKYGFMFVVWAQLIRRKFLIENGLKFTGLYGEDGLFIRSELYCAERYLIVSNRVNCYRLRDDSNIHRTIAWDEYLHSRLYTLKVGMSRLEKLLDEQKYFAQRPQFKYSLLENFTKVSLELVEKVFAKTEPHLIAEFLRQEFGVENSLTTATLFTLAARHLFKEKYVADLQRINREQAAYISELEKFIVQSQRRVAESEAEKNL